MELRLLAGCTDVDFHWSENRSNAKVVGFVDDSLVMVGDYRYWEEITDEWNGGYSDIEGFGHERLCVYNYRVQEDGPRWCDSLSSESATGMFGMKDQGSSTSAGQMTDSVIWAIRSSNTISLWKIREKATRFIEATSDFLRWICFTKRPHQKIRRVRC